MLRNQHPLLVILTKWKKTLEIGENVCTIFMDFSKACDTINHDPLLAIKSYGFSENALTLMCSYLTHKVSVLPSYRIQSVDLHSKSIDWFLYEGNTGT